MRIGNTVSDISLKKEMIQYTGGGWYSPKVSVIDPKCDGINTWTGDININRLRVTHGNPLPYSRHCHPDVFQAFAMDAITHKKNTFDVEYITIDQAKVYIPKGNPHVRGFMFTEICRYKRIFLFPHGLDYIHLDSSGPWFLQMTNVTDCVIGSPNNPIDGDRTSGLGIRIGVAKEGVELPSNNIKIYTKGNVPIDLSKKVKNCKIIKIK